MTDYTKLVRKMRTCIGDKKCFEKECRYWSELGCMDGNICCDAAAAIEALQADMKTYGDTAFNEGYEMGFAAGEARAEKRMEPKRGEWVRVEDGESYHYECSECGERPLYSRYGDVVLSGGCPMCGAKMEVRDD